MKANNILKTLFTCSVQEHILGAHSSKSAVHHHGSQAIDPNLEELCTVRNREQTSPEAEDED